MVPPGSAGWLLLNCTLWRIRLVLIVISLTILKFGLVVVALWSEGAFSAE